MADTSKVSTPTKNRSKLGAGPLIICKALIRDSLKTTKPIRSPRTGAILPREATFVRAVESLGRQLILVNFGPAGEEYLFPDEIVPRTDCFAGSLTEGDG